MIEIKGDYRIDDAVTVAKEKYARELGFVNQMEYRLMKAIITGNGQILMLNVRYEKDLFQKLRNNKNNF